MKLKKIIVLLTLPIFFTLNSCENSFVWIDVASETTTINVPDILEPEESTDDPEETGVACAHLSKNILKVDLIEDIIIPDELPVVYDLSESMPPVRSQGQQGSCVSWATTYYLKSYQEKIQFGYDYDSFEDVMSPAFVYNQTKANPNCGSGSSIVDALELLKIQGTSTWQDFPYSDQVCSDLPSEDLLEEAAQHKIKDYFTVGVPLMNTDPKVTQINLMKTLLSQGHPVVMSFDIKRLNFDDATQCMATSFNESSDPSSCGHAVLIVGYDDTLNAFKFVNSWGTGWGDEGYCWINYDFFLPSSIATYEKGVSGLYMGYDDEIL